MNVDEERSKDQLLKSAAFLLDNRDFNVVMDYIEVEATHTLVHGQLDTAADNLRSLRAIQVVRSAIGNMAADALRKP